MRQPNELLQRTQIDISIPFTAPMLLVLRLEFVRQDYYSVKPTHNPGLSSLSWDSSERCLLPSMPGLAAANGSHALLQAFHLFLVQCSPSLQSKGALQRSHAEMSDWKSAYRVVKVFHVCSRPVKQSAERANWRHRRAGFVIRTAVEKKTCDGPQCVPAAFSPAACLLPAPAP